AFWMLPDSNNWVPEIDVTEILGDKPSTTYMTLHYYNTTGAYVQTQSQYTGADFSAGYHTFGVDWEPGALVWYVDGVERKRVTDTTAIPHVALYLLANLAVGGTWPGSPDSSTVFPAYMNIDYIRAWTRSGSAPAPTATPQPPTTAGSSLLQNGSFDSGGASPWYAPWGFRNDLGASFSQDSSTTANGSPASLKATLPSANSSQPWVVAVDQQNRALSAGQSYTLSYWAKASSSRSLQAVVQEQGSPYTEYAHQTATLSTSWQKYATSFTAPVTTASAMLNFNLADAPGTLWLDEVSLCPSGSSCRPLLTVTGPYHLNLPLVRR
ncbi:MAG TPA: carbohydrate binding domain-containing protein, partial [Anaerolineaceae bacterium]